MSPEPIGAVSVSIEGDYSQLQSDFDAAVSAAQSAGQEIAAGLTPGFDQVSAAADAASAQLAGLDESMEATVPASSDASAGLGNFSTAAVDAGHSAEEAHSMFTELLEGLLAFAGIEFGIELIKELGQEMISSADKIDHTAISLTALTGNAEGSVETLGKLEELAREDALSFPNLQSAAQRMTAFLGPSADVVDILGHVADAAAARTGKDVEAAANSFDRAAASGTLNSRSLMALGLTLNDVATAMGTTSDAAKDAFKALDQSDRIDVLTEALSKFEGLAGATADTISGRWQQLKNDWETALIAMGEALSPLIKGLETLADELVQGVGLAFQGLVLAINALGGPLGLHIQTTKDAEQAAAAHALAVVGEKEALSGEVGTVDQSSEAHARAMASVLAHSHEIQAAADVLKQYNLTSVDEAKALLAAGDANITTTKAVGDAAATLANYGVVNVDAAAKITATANAQLQATSGANQHADAIHKAAQVLADFGIATTAEADALDKSKGEHDAVTTAVQTAAKELEKYGITTTAAGLAIQQLGGIQHGSQERHRASIRSLRDRRRPRADRHAEPKIPRCRRAGRHGDGEQGNDQSAGRVPRRSGSGHQRYRTRGCSSWSTGHYDVRLATPLTAVNRVDQAWNDALGANNRIPSEVLAGGQYRCLGGCHSAQDLGNTVLDVTTALTAWDSELGISSKDVEVVTQTFYDLSNGIAGASGYSSKIVRLRRWRRRRKSIDGWQQHGHRTGYRDR